MHNPSDTIAAIITPRGTGAVSMLRISGPQAISCVAHHFSKPQKLSKARTHTVHFGIFADTDTKPVDEVVCILYRKPYSYTGEDTIEICCHGNPMLANRILQVLLEKCRLAEPGEFTQRAYLNGKMDLSQAEAVNDLIQAKTFQAGHSALGQLQGFLAKGLGSLLERITNLR
ncbi:MAG: tRNA uridine-5-carboxymethylaminomethyl(34) synthesis GTPase MnmE, partial [Candidatus Cloacimonadaceae bacterium]|nr:tRNA uridine-5-carboxymethylaminomethyl(34) synthesis GTPase MnmE [Candidatus Cloacimonadaceae bacterium]